MLDGQHANTQLICVRTEMHGKKITFSPECCTRWMSLYLQERQTQKEEYTDARNWRHLWWPWCLPFVSQRCDSYVLLRCIKIRFIVRTWRWAAASCTQMYAPYADVKPKLERWFPPEEHTLVYFCTCWRAKYTEEHIAHTLQVGSTSPRTLYRCREDRYFQVDQTSITSTPPQPPPTTTSWFYPRKATLALIPSDLYTLAKNQISDLHAWANLAAMPGKELLSLISLGWNSYMFLSQLLSLITFISIQTDVESWQWG